MMARSGAFGKRGKFLGAGIAVLAVLSLLLYYGVASGTDFVRTDRLWSFEASAKILVLGLSIAVIVYLGISLLKNRLSLRRYTLLAWSWFVVFFPFRRFVCNPFPAFCWDRMEYLYLGLSKNGLGVDFDGGARRIPPDGCWETNRAGARRFHTLPVPTGAGKIWVVCRRFPRGSAGRGCLPGPLFHGKPGGHFPPGHGLCFLGFQCGDISGRRVSGPVKMAACGPGCPSFLWKDAALNLFGGERPVFCDFVDGSSCLSMDA